MTTKLSNLFKERLLAGLPETLYVGLAVDYVEYRDPPYCGDPFPPKEPDWEGYQRIPISQATPDVRVDADVPGRGRAVQVFVAAAPVGGDVYWVTSPLPSGAVVFLRWPIVTFTD